MNPCIFERYMWTLKFKYTLVKRGTEIICPTLYLGSECFNDGTYSLYEYDKDFIIKHKQNYYK